MIWALNLCTCITLKFTKNLSCVEHINIYNIQFSILDTTTSSTRIFEREREVDVHMLNTFFLYKLLHTLIESLTSSFCVWKERIMSTSILDSRYDDDVVDADFER